VNRKRIKHADTGRKKRSEIEKKKARKTKEEYYLDTKGNAKKRNKCTEKDAWNKRNDNDKENTTENKR
jgi:hypothetical protein